MSQTSTRDRRLRASTRPRERGALQVACALATLTALIPSVGHAQFTPGAHHTTVGAGTGLQGQVSPTGGFAASVPLNLPAPRGGIPVPLSVVYTGAARAGAAGVGWDVPLSYVAWQRDIRTKPSANGDGEMPRRLWMSIGGNTVQMLPMDAAGTRFRPVVAGEYQELFREGSGMVLRTLGNLEYRFTRDPQAPAGDDGPWLLDTITDLVGTDHVKFEYNAPAIGGCAPDRVISKVSYGYPQQLSDLDPGPLFEIELGYEGWWRPKGEIGTSQIVGSRVCASRPTQLGATGEDEQVVFDHSADRMVPTLRTAVLTSVRVRARDNLAPAAPRRTVRSYQLAYQPDADTAKPRLTTVTLRGLDGVGELPVATYRYEAMTQPDSTGRFQLGAADAVPRSPALPGRYRTELGHSDTQAYPETSTPTSLGETRSRERKETQLRHTIRDMTGDGIPDEIWKESGSWHLARGTMTDAGPRLDGTVSTWVEPAELDARVVTYPLADLVLHEGDDEHDRAIVTETWSQLIDWNGDGRLDVVDARGGVDWHHWKVWINEAAPGGGLAWRGTDVDLRAFVTFRSHLGLDALVPILDHVPVARARSWPRSTTRTCKSTYCPVWGGACLENVPCWDHPDLPDPTIPIVYPSDTWSEWELADVNEDGYPDLLTESAQLGVCDDDRDPPRGYQPGYTIPPYPGYTLSSWDDNYHREKVGFVPCKAEGGIDHDASPPARMAFLNRLGAFDDDHGRWTPVPVMTEAANTRWVTGAIDGLTSYESSIDPDEPRVAGESWLSRSSADLFSVGREAERSVGSRLSLFQTTPLFYGNEKLCDDGAVTYADENRAGFLDVNGDGLLDQVRFEDDGVAVALNSGAGFGDGLGGARVVQGEGTLAMSAAIGDCATRQVREVGGWMDLDADGVADYLKMDGNTLTYAPLITGSGAPAYTAGRLVAIENGYGAVTRIHYANAKIDPVTSHAVPMPEIVVSDVTTEVTNGAGPGLATTYYRYGDASYDYDGMSASWTFSGYRRSLALTGVPAAEGMVRGVLTLTTRGPHFAPGAGFVAKVTSGRVESVSQAEGEFNPRFLHQYLVPGATSPTPFTETRYQYTGRLAATAVLPGGPWSPLDTGEMVDGYWTQGPDDGFATGYVLQTDQRTWEGDPLPSTDNTYAGTSVTGTDAWGRVTETRDHGDLRRGDDDTCTALTYGNGTPLPSVVTSVTITDCGVDGQQPRLLGRARLLYDGLPFGQVARGRVSSRQVDRFDAAGVYLGTFETGRYSYDALGQVAKVVSARTIGGAVERTTIITRDVFGATARTISVTASDVAETFVRTMSVSVLPDRPATSTDMAGVVTRVYTDAFGRRVRTEATGGGRSWTLDTVKYNDVPTGRTIEVETFPDSDDLNADASRTIVSFDALGREVLRQTSLGRDYEKRTLVSNLVKRDAFGRVEFATAPFEYGSEAFTWDHVVRYGTTYVYDTRGRLLRTVDALGENLQADRTDVANRVFVATQAIRYIAGQAQITTQGGDDLDPSSVNYFASSQRWLTATGREVARVRYDGHHAPLDRLETRFDRLGRVTATRRFANPGSLTPSVSWTTEYDSLGNATRMVEPNIDRHMDYDEFGALIRTQWTDTGGASRAVSTGYDGLGRVVSVERTTTPSGGVAQLESSEKYHYDVAAPSGAQPEMDARLLRGKLSWIDGDAGAAYFRYDWQGRTTGTYYEYAGIAGTVAEEVDLTVGGQLRGLGLTTPWSTDKISYGYDTAGRMRTVDRDGERLLDADVSDVGQYLAVRYGNSTVDHRQYASDGPRELLSWETLTQSGRYGEAYVARDGSGRVTERLESTPDDDLSVRSSYDGMGRLAVQQRGPGVDFEFFTYDPLGNLRIRANASPASLVATPAPGDPDKLCRFAAAPGACQFTYDGAGNVTEDLSTGELRTFTYDAGQRITQMVRGGVRVDVTHGPLGRAKLEVIGGPRPRTVWSFGDLIEYRVRPDGVAQIDRRIPGPEGPFVSLRTELDRDGGESAKETVYIHGDSQANRVFTGGNGKVVQATTYDPYGRVTGGGDDASLTGSDDLWNGGDDLPEIGVTLLGPRAYDPALGRFLQRDPISVLSSSSRGNPYTFSFGDPENLSDPSGLCPAERATASCVSDTSFWDQLDPRGGGGGSPTAHAPPAQVGVGYKDVNPATWGPYLPSTSLASAAQASTLEGGSPGGFRFPSMNPWSALTWAYGGPTGPVGGVIDDVHDLVDLARGKQSLGAVLKRQGSKKYHEASALALAVDPPVGVAMAAMGGSKLEFALSLAAVVPGIGAASDELIAAAAAIRAEESTAATAVRELPTLTKGPGGKMLGEAVGYLRGIPGAERAAAFERFAQQITEATNGQWSAKAFSGTNARVFAGEGGEALVFDSAGNMFRGHLSDRGAFVFREGGQVEVIFNELRGL